MPPSPSRILLVSNLFPPDVLGGYELVMAEVVERLRARGHTVHVLTSGEPHPNDPDWIHRALELIRPFGEPAAGLDRIRHARARGRQEEVIRRILRAVRPDVVLSGSMRRLGLHVQRVLAQEGIPVVHALNDEWLLAHRPAPGVTALRRLVGALIETTPLGARTWRGVPFDDVVYPSAALRENLRRGGAPLPEGRVCHHGVDRRLFPERPDRLVPRQPRLLFVGRLAKEKGADVALDALALLRRSGIDASLTIVGQGAERDALGAQVASQHLEDHVHFAGFAARETLGRVYQDHDVFLFPCRWEEPAGLTYLEAMSSGIPVIAEPRGGARELIRNGENALVACDAHAMARGVMRLIEDPALRARIVAGGLKTAVHGASLDRYADTIEAALLDARARAQPRGVGRGDANGSAHPVQ